MPNTRRRRIWRNCWRGVRFVGRSDSRATATAWAQELGATARWVALAPIKWVCDLGVGPVSPSQPEVVCRQRALVLPAAHPYPRRLVPRPGWQLPPAFPPSSARAV